ncbi:hypothetical protein MiSe_94260 [Microseira wollei NIES-4236]|uniref:Transposase n=1 Tax=Microseira wollei NIES-4236 TaxID=2530354 RepID=A0AAV3XSZ1_9CYAN|nr:hypothetical protein MiSe_94260 [Microseira wollei NIES-4236]
MQPNLKIDRRLHLLDLQFGSKLRELADLVVRQ